MFGNCYKLVREILMSTYYNDKRRFSLDSNINDSIPPTRLPRNLSKFSKDISVEFISILESQRILSQFVHMQLHLKRYNSIKTTEFYFRI